MSGRVTRSVNRHRRSYPEMWPEHVDASDCRDVKHEKYVTQARAEVELSGPTGAPGWLPCGCAFIILGLWSS
jgi:hypothetical protein